MTGSQSSSAAEAVRTILASVRAGSGGKAPGDGGRDGVGAVEGARPARTVAARLAAAGGAGQAAARLRELVERHLGGSAPRWLGLHDALAGHRGTLPALLADVPPPAPPAAPGELRPPLPRSVHETLALLLEHAAPDHAAAALAALPDRTVDKLLSGGPLPGPGLTAAVTEHGDSRARVALAGHSRLDTRVLARLLAVGDARVGAAVYRSPRATQSLRRTLAHRLDAVPMDEALRAELTDPRGTLPRTWLAPLLGSGDPALVARALTVGPRGVAQQYALARVWERAGRDAVRGLLGDPAVARHLTRTAVEAVNAALSDDASGASSPNAGPGSAPHRLYERGEPYGDPRRLPGLLSATRGTSTLRDLLSEPYVHDLPALYEAHLKSPFMPGASEELARHEDASDAQRAAFRLSVLNESWRTGGRRAGNVTPPERRLAEEPLGVDAAWWAKGMVGAGLLDPVELIRTAHPARLALAALGTLAERELLTGGAVAELRSLAETHLGAWPETWAALDHLLPTHRGTLRELIIDAAATAPPSALEAAVAPATPGVRPTTPSGRTPTGPASPPANDVPTPAAPPRSTAGTGKAAAPGSRPSPADTEKPTAPAPGPPPSPANDRKPAAPAAPPTTADTGRPAAPGPPPSPANDGRSTRPASAPTTADTGRPATPGPPLSTADDRKPATPEPSPSAALPVEAAATAPGASAQGEPPVKPRRPAERAALAALDLLRSLAPGDAPLPADPGVLAFLAHHSRGDAPGLATPEWLVRACAAVGGVEPPDAGSWHTAPTAAEVRAAPVESWGSSVTLLERAYTQGLVPADELLGLLAARHLLLLPHDWRRLAFAAAWRAALARLLRAELGTDPEAWLRLAAAAGDASAGVTWRELLSAARSGSPSDTSATPGEPGSATPPPTTPAAAASPPARAGAASGAAGSTAPIRATTSTEAGAPSGSAPPARTATTPGDVTATASWYQANPPWATHTARPGSPEEAIGLLRHGDHLWAWPVGTLLCLADAEVVDAVLPRLGPDGPWLLAAYLLRHDRTPRAVFERLLADRDPRALAVLGAGCRWLADGLLERLADVDDPDTDVALLRHARDPLVVSRIVARTRRSQGPSEDGTGAGVRAEGPTAADPVAARVLAEQRAEPSSWPLGGAHWLCSAEPDLVEEILVRHSADLSFLHQALGCLHLLEYGGADRLRALVGRELLGQAAAKLCVKALAPGTGDPAAVIRARIDRELDPAKLVKKLRRSQNHWQTTSTVAAVLPGVDWRALAAAHEEEPLPHWKSLVTTELAPAELRLRYAELVPEPGPDGLPDGAELTRARARHGLGGLYHCPPATQFDGLLASGLLSGSDLLHLAAPAALVLGYLGGAARRPDAPPQAAAALAELAALVASRLGTDARAWSRVTDRLTGRDPRWDPISPTVALLTLT